MNALHSISPAPYQSSLKEKKNKLGFHSHSSYQATLREYLDSLDKNSPEKVWIKAHVQKLMAVYYTNLDPIQDMIASLYSPDKRGNPATKPFAIIRSMLLMLEFREISIEKWAERVRTEPILAIFSGFGFSRPPCNSTYYKLLERLEDGPYQRKCAHRVLPSEMRRKRSKERPPCRKPDKKQVKEKEPVPPPALEALAKEIRLRQREPLPGDLEKRLNEMLMEVAIKPSAEKGLIGDIEKLTITGDGSTLPSGANRFGKPTCECHKQGDYKCDHKRIYSDPDAQWGWDNQVKGFVFGYRYDQLVCSEKGHDLPMYLSIDSANAHEALMCMKMVERFQKQNQTLLPGASIAEIGLDAIHDANAFYHFLYDRKIQYAIPYAKTPAKCLTLGNLTVNSQGIPLCKAGLPMRCIGLNRQKKRAYCCPVKRPARRNKERVYVTYREECPLEALCQPGSILGPIVSIAPETDPRVHPEIPRGSKEYRRLLDLRSGCERSNSMKKQYYRLKYDKGRTMPYTFIKLALASILEHVKVWVRKKYESVEDKDDLLSLFE